MPPAAGSSLPLVQRLALCTVPRLHLASVCPCAAPTVITPMDTSHGAFVRVSEGKVMKHTFNLSAFIEFQSFPGAKHSVEGASGAGLTSRDCRFWGGDSVNLVAQIQRRMGGGVHSVRGWRGGGHLRGWRGGGISGGGEDGRALETLGKENRQSQTGRRRGGPSLTLV